jgi:ribonuclease HII
MKKSLIVGVDEAGRGPLAGPVAVGVAVVPKSFDWQALVGVTDSKQLSAKKRAAIFETAKTLKKAKQLDYTVSLVSAAVIDKIGITKAISLALERALLRLEADPKTCQIKLDGGLKAPAQYQQETIIKGDQKEKVIGLASICAKETRDLYMVRKQALPAFAPYDFATHKGYGTNAHRAAIKQLGLSVEHRKSFCKNCM